jgi:hypothetical protein
MTATLHRPASTSPVEEEQARSEVGQLDDPGLLRHIEPGAEAVDRAAERHRRAEQLAALANGDREPLENLRARYLRHLHRTGSDFDAIEGLRTVEVALSMTPRPEGPWAWQRRERDRPRRWWHRHRSMQP